VNNKEGLPPRYSDLLLNKKKKKGILEVCDERGEEIEARN
jgi:hypothetical protein